MHLAWNVGLLAALLLAPGMGTAAPRGRPTPRRPLELRASLHESPGAGGSAEHVLRKLPASPEPPGAYVRFTRWVEDVALPAPDGKPKLVVVTVPGGLALAWARRW